MTERFRICVPFISRLTLYIHPSLEKGVPKRTHDTTSRRDALLYQRKIYEGKESPHDTDGQTQNFHLTR